MKIYTILTMLALAVALTGCPYIASGESKAPDLVTQDELQGCYYYESYNINRDTSSISQLSCHKDCIVDTMFYEQHWYYEGPSNFPYVDSALAGSTLWNLEDTYEHVETIFARTPEEDGNYYKPIRLGSMGTYDIRYYTKEEFFSEYTGWVLCSE